MYTVRTPKFAQFLFSRFIWRLIDTETVYLTFDDGPIPEATPWVLDQLKAYDAKATFFCVGENVKNHPNIYQRILAEGHTVGNHTYNHLNAWKSKKHNYISNVDQASDLISSKLFRPPYGKLTPSLSKRISKNYDIIMWDVLSGDFDSNITAEKCLSNVKKNAREGSIIVFHDSIKAIEKLKVVLPQALAYFKEKGIEMKSIPMD